MRAVYAQFLICALVVGLVPGCGADSQGPKALRHYEYRGIGGFSMGSMTAATLGMRHHEKFDIIAPLGGAIDLGLFLHIIKDELMAGFCEPPVLGQMCPAPGVTSTYETMDVGPASQGGFRREGMIEAFQDMAIALGNPILFNPDHPYLPPGMPPLLKSVARPHGPVAVRLLHSANQPKNALHFSRRSSASCTKLPLGYCSIMRSQADLTFSMSLLSWNRRSAAR